MPTIQEIAQRGNDQVRDFVKHLQEDPPPFSVLVQLLQDAHSNIKDLQNELFKWACSKDQLQILSQYQIKVTALGEALLHSSEITAEPLVRELLPVWKDMQQLLKDLKRKPPQLKLRLKEIKAQTNKQDWRDALTTVSNKIAGIEPDEEIKLINPDVKPEDVANGVEDAHLLMSQQHIKKRLLKETEDCGVIEACVTLARSFFPKRVVTSLTDQGWSFKFVLHQYLMINNAKIFGVHESIATASLGRRKANPTLNFSHALNQYNNLGLGCYAWVIAGPIIKKGSHFYGLVFPSDIWMMDDASMIQEWDFANQMIQNTEEKL